MKDSQPGAMIECYACRCWREIIETWWWAPQKAKLRRHIARHKHEIFFELGIGEKPGPVPPSLLAHMPNLRRAE